jgi:hypothetical protein
MTAFSAVGSAMLGIDSVSYPDQGEKLLAQHLEEPPSGGRPGRGYALDIRGWGVGQHESMVEVELLDGDASLRRVPVDIRRPDIPDRYPDAPGSDVSGFFLTCNTLRVAPDFDLTLRAWLADGSSTELARITGTRAPLRPSFSPARQPLMVTSMGRTGSTMLVRLLGEHPDVVMVPPFEYEPKVATYWAEILLELTDPAGYRRQVAPGRNLNGRWWLGDTTPLPRPIKNEAVSGWLDSDAIIDVADFCLSRVDALYDRIAARDGKQSAALFTEKYWGATSTPSLVRELYPRRREVFMVRDFRDMLASMYAFDEKIGFVQFGRQFAESDAQHVQRLGRRAARLLASFRAEADRAPLVRYEDLVNDPDATLATLLERLELDGGPATVAAMRKGLERSDVAHHVTTDDPAQSIGRWRRDLPPALQDTAQEAFAPALEGFGYKSSD